AQPGSLVGPPLEAASSIVARSPFVLGQFVSIRLPLLDLGTQRSQPLGNHSLHLVLVRGTRLGLEPGVHTRDADQLLQERDDLFLVLFAPWQEFGVGIRHTRTSACMRLLACDSRPRARRRISSSFASSR